MKISNRFVALENVDVDSNRETIRDNTKIEAKNV
jgi:hypothetical protein